MRAMIAMFFRDHVVLAGHVCHVCHACHVTELTCLLASMANRKVLVRVLCCIFLLCLLFLIFLLLFLFLFFLYLLLFFLSLRLLFFLFPLIFLLLLFSFLFSLPRRWISHHPLQPARRLASGTCATMSDMHNHVGHAANTTMQLATVRDLLRLFSMPCQVNASSAGGLCTSFPGTCLTRSNQ